MKNFYVFLCMFVLITAIASPSLVFAQPAGGSGTGINSGGGAGTGINSPTVTPSVTATAHLENPLAGVNSLSDLFYNIVNFVISFSYIIIAFFLILSGFKFVAAQGSPDKLDDAKHMFYYTIIGAVIIVGAQTITTVVQNILTGLGK
jgi:hypothetical protein